MKFPVSARTFSFLALGAALVGVPIGSTGCRTVNSPTVAEVGHIVENCAAPDIHDVAIDVLDDVASALVTQDYSGGIRAVVASLVSGVGSNELARATDAAFQAVKCAVAELLGQTNVHLGYGGLDPKTELREKLLHDNAASWLAAH